MRDFLLRKWNYFSARLPPPEWTGSKEAYRKSLQESVKELTASYPGSECASIITKDGVRIQGMFLRPTNPIQPTKVVILAAGSDRSIFDSGYRYLLQAYLSRGIYVMACDYREVGLSEGTFSVKGSCRDIEAAFRYIRDEKHILSKDILVEGYSYGSSPALSLAAHEPDIKLLLRAPISSYYDVCEGIRKSQKGAVSSPPSIRERIEGLRQQFVLPSVNKRWISTIKNDFHIIYANDFCEENGVQSTDKLLQAYVGRKPIEEEKKKWASCTGSTDHFEPYQDATEKNKSPLTQALDSFLQQIGFVRSS